MKEIRGCIIPRPQVDRPFDLYAYENFQRQLEATRVKWIIWICFAVIVLATIGILVTGK